MMSGLRSWVQRQREQYRAWRATWPNTPNDWRKQLCAYYELYWQDHGWMRPFYNRPHEIAPGVFRGNQPSPRQIAKLAKQGFKTIVNLRGPSECGFYYLEKKACDRYGILLKDAKLYSRQMPPFSDLQHLFLIYEDIELPAFFHCKSGADRAGLASALYLMVQKSSSVGEAKRQLSLKFLHFKASKTGRLDYFLECYQQQEQKGILFKDWLANSYEPKELQKKFQHKGLISWFVDVVLRRE